MAREAATIRASCNLGIYAGFVAFLFGLAVFAELSGAALAAEAARPQRIVSINACTDQLLFALADREQIAALSHYAVEEDFSIYADAVRASGIPLLRGNAEEVLKLKPDLVLAGTFTRRATRQLLQRFRLKLALFPPAVSVEETKAAIRQAARLFGHEARGEALIAEIDRALAAAPDLGGRGMSVLQLQRRGFVSGPDTLISDLLRRLGVRNAAEGFSGKGVVRASLEVALKARADALVLLDPIAKARDQGSAMLLHPALESTYPADRRIVLPGRLVVCGGPALPMAIASLSGSLRQLSGRQ